MLVCLNVTTIISAFAFPFFLFLLDIFSCVKPKSEKFEWSKLLETSS
jgi:hypothetical protein